ncbi:MAG: beta-Ala-His dipeptidase [Oscillospiraceae bacterium]|nr:beta-Ala-His dipeptidase [Oscillospiraceae bacterium]
MNSPILDNFLSLCAIPRKSHHEEQVSRFLADWGRAQGLAVCRDPAGNVILDAPASPGLENAPTTILQAHMDMVAVGAEGSDFDPLRDPVTPVREGDWLRAQCSSLGADDGAGVAIAMTILADKSAVHGPLRAVFTTDEEDGMSGANALEPRHLQGDYLINLDWEGFGSLCCSSAGSDMYAFHKPARWSEAGNAAFFAVTVQGLEGGHSGAQIHLGRKNAIRLLTEILLSGSEAAGSLVLSAFKGGSAHNAIPSSASAVAAVPEDKAELFLAAARKKAGELLQACAATDPGAQILLGRCEGGKKVLPVFLTRDILGMLSSVHDGVNTMSKSIPGLVESSANTGLAELDEEEFRFVIHQRSSEPAITADMKRTFAAQARTFDFTMETLASGAPWPVKADSRLVELTRRRFRALFGREISVEPIHAGLECGCFSQKNPGLDIISIGPDLQDIHSPRERLYLPSMEDCDTLVRALLKDIAAL